MEETRKLLGNQIRELRQRCHLTQEKLGQKAELNYKYLGAVERGERNPSLDNLTKIACALGVEVHDLFIFKTKTDPKPIILEIDEMLRDADEKELGKVYKVVKAILK